MFTDCICVGAHKGPKMVLDSLELKSRVVVGDPIWVLRAESRSSAGTVLVLDC